MPKRIKVLVDFRDEKYSLFIDSNNELIRFNSVLNQFNKQTKRFVSFESHLFEIYDSDFKQFVSIPTTEQIIDNLSRIRVKPKDTNQLKTHLIDERLNQMTLRDKDLSKQISEINNKLDKYLYKSHESINNLIEDIIVNNEKVVENEQLISFFTDSSIYESSDSLIEINYGPNCGQLSASGSGSVATCCPISGAVNTNAINYLDLKLMDNYGYSADCRHLSYKTFIDEFRNKPLVTIRYHLDDSEAINQLLQILDKCRHYFQKYPTNGSFKWKSVSDQMFVNHFKEWSPERCRDGFRCALEVYKKTLDKCPDLLTANKVNPLFSRYHSFDLKFIVCLAEFNELRQMRDSFQEKIRSKQCNTGYQFKKFGSNLSLNSSDFNSRTEIKAQNKSIVENPKLNAIPALNEFEIETFKVLANSVDSIAKFGSFSQLGDQFWDLIGHQMKTKGHLICAKTLFLDKIIFYEIVLTEAPNYITAVEVYPLFEVIESMDLSQCLSGSSFRKIRDLRHEFWKKCCIV